MNTHERKARDMIARRRYMRRDQCVLAREPAARTTYLWADPDTSTTGTCRYGLKQWMVPPGGKDPVLFERPETRRTVSGIRNELERLSLLPIATDLCARYRVELYEVLGESRTSTLPEVRARLYAAIRMATGWSTPKLGDFFGRNASTIRAQIVKYCPEAMTPQGMRAEAVAMAVEAA